MTVLDDTIAEFGRSMGIEDLRLNDNGTVVLSIHSLGLLGLDRAGTHGESVLISLTRPLPSVRSGKWAELLAATHPQAHPPAGLQIGVIREQLVLAMLIEQAEFTLPRIHEVIGYLDRQHASLEAGP
jgi:type III secretion system chaperone SycN